MNTQPEISDSVALVFLRGKKGADSAEIHSDLLLEDSVAASIPVLGEWNIMLRLAAKDRESLKRIVEERIRQMKGIEDLETHCCEETWTAAGDNEGLRASACAVLDVDCGGLSALVAQFRAMPGITEVNVTDGGKKIVLFLRGNSSRGIRNVVKDEIRPLPGVLRIKLLDSMNFSAS